MAEVPAPIDAASPATAPPPSLAGKVLSGIGWSVGSQLIVQLSRVVVGVALARLLTPHEFGIAGMAIVFAGIATIFTDPSLGAALIQRPQITEEDRSTVFWTAFACGLACTAIGIGVSGLIGRFYGEPQVSRLFAVLSTTFTLSALGVAPGALLTREMKYRSLQLRGTVSIIFGGVVAVAVAALGFGAWAIIAQSLAGAVVGLILVWLASPWRPHLVYSKDSLRNLGGFGIKLLGSRLLAYANLNADNMLVGRFLGPAALGAYGLAYNVMFTPMSRVGEPIQQVTSSAFARIQNDPARLAAAWLRSKRLSAAVLAPAFLGVLVVAPDLIPVVFGHRWHAAVPVLQLLCLAGVAHSLVTLNWSTLQARGKAGTLFRLGLFTTALTLAAFVVGLRWGISGVAGSYALMRWLLVVPDTWITCRGMAVRTWEALRAGGSVLPIALGMAAVAWGVRLSLVAVGVAPAIRLVLVIMVGLVLYPALARLATPTLFEEIRDIVRRARANPSASTP